MRRGRDADRLGHGRRRLGGQQQKASAKARLTADGKLTVVQRDRADIGTGTYTVMTQIAAETLGLPIEDVTFQLGDSALPEAPVEGGSFTAASVGSAVKAACGAVGEELFELARKVDGSPLAEATLDDVDFAEGRIRLAHDPSRSVSIAEAMRQGKVDVIEEEATPPNRSKQDQYRGTRTRRSSPRWRWTRTSARSASRGS